MAWTPTLIRKWRDSNTYKFTVSFTDGTDKIAKTFELEAQIGVSADWLKQQCTLFIQQLTDAGAFAAAQSEGGVIDLTGFVWPVPDTPRTPAQIARDDWFDRLARMKNAKMMVDLGILTGSETQYTALRDGLKTDLKASYI